jgi:hypothetical protein
MSRLFYALTLIFLFFNYAIAAPLDIAGASKALMAAEKFKRPVAPIYRTGARNDVVGGAVRPKDFHTAEDGMVHADDHKGLSFSKYKTDPADISKDKAVHSIKPYQLQGTDFHAVHDGGRDGNPIGHVSLTYRGGASLTPQEMKQKLNTEIPWVKERGTGSKKK